MTSKTSPGIVSYDSSLALVSTKQNVSPIPTTVMKNLSRWAKSHPIQARWIIAAAHLLLFLLAFCAGFLLWLNDFEYSPIALDVFTTLFLLGVIFYPIKRAKHLLWKHSYERQKTFDFVIVLTGFLSLTSLTSIKMEQASMSASTAYALKTASLMPEEKSSQRTSFREKISWRHLVKNAKMLKKELKQARKLSKTEGDQVGLKILLTVLTFILAIGLAGVIAYLSCWLACDGMEGAATLVAIGGVALIVFLTIISIRAIWQ
ncbi:MAG TPA: hypothetical protein DCF33_08495 [Saprospirales bacterium]|nr:hypothetical protein [Saprospirales bacterium]